MQNQRSNELKVFFQEALSYMLYLWYNCSPPGSSVHGILQARILEWISISFSRGSSPCRLNLGLLHCRWILYHLSHQGSLILGVIAPIQMIPSDRRGITSNIGDGPSLFE